MDSAEVESALQPVLRDLKATCAVRPVVRTAEADGLPGVFLYEPDGSGLMVTPVEWLRDGAEQLAHLAEQAQEWAVEALWGAGRPAVWPQCPAHPDSHPLEAGVRGGTAVWSCPRGRGVFAGIGELGDAAGL
ncbi:hypothetical protein ACFQVC_19895 [Streptomyces monticola]|uniref:GNAT family N-acetyltransferase n=1 Tax=Streptomyces monticola TaxID=2666263 RepID=A0ABW2JK18_9ACTN